MAHIFPGTCHSLPEPYGPLLTHLPLSFLMEVLSTASESYAGKQPPVTAFDKLSRGKMSPEPGQMQPCQWVLQGTHRQVVCHPWFGNAGVKVSSGAPLPVVPTWLVLTGKVGMLPSHAALEYGGGRGQAKMPRGLLLLGSRPLFLV